MSGILDGLIRLVAFLVRSLWIWFLQIKTGKWTQAEAVVSDHPTRLDGFALSSVEFPYSYRVDGELYTGLHEEPCFLSEAEYMERFRKGRTFVVRVKPGQPELSVVREKDQSDTLDKVLGK